ncbi:response regulator [Dyadobacter sandarakinus]|uniref:Response regulator n=1 Tax=Dyadobacter sandarakinus TaxID=2747268 RepID=A0ABX7I3F1_9BACT|nr:response regulator [Dyadobacter sandarakinus]QRR00082.1 response regulator [Dyadobacter sandarakinus]
MKKMKTVFLVDDDEDDRMLLLEALGTVIKHLNIIEIPSGSHLMALMKTGRFQHEPELILLDMNMPVINGLEIVKKLKDNERTRHIPVVMISTTSSRQLIGEAYRRGVNAFMIKPVIASDYEIMAMAINVCFLHSSQYELPVSSPKYHQNKMIMVVEDSDDHWELMSFSLTQTMPDIQLVRMTDKNATMELLNTQFENGHVVPELILLDLYLPSREEGLDLLASIRRFIEVNNLPEVPIIIFSHSGHQDDIRACYGKWANAYLVKPQDASVWPEYFKSLSHFWLKTFSFPKM